VAWHKEGCIGDHSVMAVVGVGTWVQTEMRGGSEIKSPEFPLSGTAWASFRPLIWESCSVARNSSEESLQSS